MNELLQKHGCANVFHIPEGLRELMADISREVLRKQPAKICDFIANYLSALLITREHGILAVKLVEDLCDCRPTVSEHLMNIGMDRGEADILAQIIKEEIESLELVEGKEKVRELEIVRRILKRKHLDEVLTSQVCEIARNAYKDYWYRKHLLEQTMRVTDQEPWEIAAQHTLAMYKKTKPSFSELTRAAVRIQAAYRGFHTRRKLLGSRKPQKVPGPKVDLPGPPVDIAESREIDLGPVVDIKDRVKLEDVQGLFPRPEAALGYDPTKTLTMTPGMGAVRMEPYGSDAFPQKDKKKVIRRDVPEASYHRDDVENAPKITFAPKSVNVMRMEICQRLEKLPEEVAGYTSTGPPSVAAASDTGSDSISDSVSEPASDPVSEPISEPISEPVSAPLSEPASDVEDLAIDGNEERIGLADVTIQEVSDE